RLDTNSAGKILVNDALLELLVVLRHEKHPKGWTGVQLLGCSSGGALVVVWIGHSPDAIARCETSHGATEGVRGGAARSWCFESSCAASWHTLIRMKSGGTARAGFDWVAKPEKRPLRLTISGGKRDISVKRERVIQTMASID
ncbi:hypothetical protein, partial [Burkholderia sp. Ac-20344]|uniref:hypothetical protein n=1 Tax=Burkholderia sp. Ac-20344 TaxID=2703890 RepID=UPI00197B148A